MRTIWIISVIDHEEYVLPQWDITTYLPSAALSRSHHWATTVWSQWSSTQGHTTWQPLSGVTDQSHRGPSLGHHCLGSSTNHIGAHHWATTIWSERSNIQWHTTWLPLSGVNDQPHRGPSLEHYYLEWKIKHSGAHHLATIVCRQWSTT